MSWGSAREVGGEEADSNLSSRLKSFFLQLMQEWTATKQCFLSSMFGFL